MNTPRSPRALSDRPVLIALLAIGLGILCTGALLSWAAHDPATVIVGQTGRHDQIGDATCLDCHVPFEGTPSSRCLGPGCHGDLATGTPPRTGPAMPMRFHVALRGHACGQCHSEHVEDVIVAFDHARIPDKVQARCRTCHLGDNIPNHARTDAVSCNVCHNLKSWTGSPMTHERVAQQACDLCHRRPETDSHASVAGTCTECHTASDWTPIEAAQDAAK